jgi:glycosyltransferase involved in cell wall biosynthesis
MKKRLLFIDTYPELGGGQQMICNLNFLNDKYSLFVLTRSKYFYKKLYMIGNVKVYLLPKSRFINIFVIRKILKEIKPSLVIFNGQFEAHYSFLWNGKKIFIRHTSLTMTSIFKRILYYIEALFFSDRIVVVNDFMKDEFPKFLRKKIEIIYNWSSYGHCKEIKKYNIKSKIFRVLYCGRIVEEKNVEMIIKALKDIDRINMDIIGYGDLLESLKMKFGNNKNIFFYGMIEHNQLKEYYQNCDLFINPSSVEAFPLTVVESMGFGLPCLLSDIPAHRSISDNGKFAILFSITNLEDLKFKVIKIMKNEIIYEKYSMLSLERSKEFNEDMGRKKYFNLISLILNKV